MNAPLPIPGPDKMPTVQDLVRRATSEGEWDVPVEMAVFCTSSAFKAVILSRYPGGDSPKRTARCFVRGGRLFAVVEFNRSEALLIPLDVHTLENRS